MKNLTWQNPEQLFVAQELINKVKSKCCGIKDEDDFMEVWEKRFQVFRNREWARKGECADCSFFRYCEGNGMHLHNDNGDLLFCHQKRIVEL